MGIVAFTVVDAGRATEVPARLEGDRVLLSPDALEAALGWTLGPEGLCGAGLCLPVPPGAPIGPDGADLAALAALLDRPLAADLDEGVAWLGTPAEERARALRSLEGPDFTLPDLAGRPHSLRDHRGKKLLLVVWASW